MLWHNTAQLLSDMQSILQRMKFPVSVPAGGTGRDALTAHGLLIGEGSNLVNVSAAGNAGQPFLSGGVGADGAFGQLENLSASSTADLTCSVTPTRIPGVFVTLDKTGLYFILGIVRASTTATAGLVEGSLVVNGVTQPKQIVSDSDNGTYSQFWLYQNSGNNVAEIKAIKTINAGVALAVHPDSSILAVFLG